MGTVGVDRLTVKKGGWSWRALGSLARWQGALSCAQLSPDAKEPEELGAEGESERWYGAPERGRQAGERRRKKAETERGAEARVRRRSCRQSWGRQRRSHGAGQGAWAGRCLKI